MVSGLVEGDIRWNKDSNIRESCVVRSSHRAPKELNEISPKTSCIWVFSTQRALTAS